MFYHLNVGDSRLFKGLAVCLIAAFFIKAVYLEFGVQLNVLNPVLPVMALYQPDGLPAQTAFPVFPQDAEPLELNGPAARMPAPERANRRLIR